MLPTVCMSILAQYIHIAWNIKSTGLNTNEVFYFPDVEWLITVLVCTVASLVISGFMQKDLNNQEVGPGIFVTGVCDTVKAQCD